MAGTRIVTPFGLRDVAVALPVTTPGTEPTWVDVPSVESAAFKLNVSEVEQYGDDTYQGTFYHTQKGSITVKFNKLSMAVFELLSGNVVRTVSGREEMYFGTEKELIPPIVLVRALVPYRDETTGQPGEQTVYWYRCTVKTPWDNIPGGERAKLGENTMMFDSQASRVNHRGEAVVGVNYAFGHFAV